VVETIALQETGWRDVYPRTQENGDDENFSVRDNPGIRYGVEKQGARGKSPGEH
jgi:hypothetical protein